MCKLLVLDSGIASVLHLPRNPIYISLYQPLHMEQLPLLALILPQSDIRHNHTPLYVCVPRPERTVFVWTQQYCSRGQCQSGLPSVSLSPPAPPAAHPLWARVMPRQPFQGLFSSKSQLYLSLGFWLNCLPPQHYHTIWLTGTFLLCLDVLWL